MAVSAARASFRSNKLGRPRIDVIVTLSGIFRDLLPLQIRLLAEACFLAASADEPEDSNFVRKHALAYQAERRLRSRDRGAARVRQRRGRLWRQRRHADRLRRLERRGRDLADTSRGASASPTGRRAARAAARRCSRARSRTVDFAYQNLDSVELGVTTHRPLFRHPRRHRPRGRSARAGRARRAGLHQRSDARRRAGALADRAGRAGDAHARAQPEMVRGHAQARLRGRAPDRGARHQHDGLVGDHRPGGALGLRAASPAPSCSIRRCARGSPAQSRRLRQADQPHPGGARARLLEAGRARRSPRSATPATKWKTASKA